MTTALPPAADTRSTTVNRSRSRKPADSAAVAAAWIVGPSITGSEYGTPTSTRSQPASIMPVSSSTDAVDRRVAGRR